MSAAARCPWRGCWALVQNTSFRSRPACALSTPWALPAQSWAVQLLQLAGLPSLTTWVEETIAKAKLCDDAKAQVVASERSAIGDDASCEIAFQHHRCGWATHTAE